MTRSLNAPLSPNEEITLRRVALGMSNPDHLSKRDIERLVHLMLVVVMRGRPELTPLGRQRYHALPRAAEVADAATTDMMVLLGRLMTKASRH